jgi:hypothetical protein
MIVQPLTGVARRGLDAWWPASADDVLLLLEEAPLVRVRACSLEVAEALSRYSFRDKPTWTLLFDLLRSKEELWSEMKRKSCRQDITKASRRQTVILRNEETERSFCLVNEHIARKGYRGPLSRREWEGLLAHGDVFSLWVDNLPVATHALLVDGSGLRVRTVFGGEVDPGLPSLGGLVGSFNRALHWHEMNHYKQEGFRTYDFGGLVLDETSPLHPIDLFKRSFGGTPVPERSLWLCRGQFKRRLLQTLARPQAVRRSLDQVARTAGRLGRPARVEDPSLPTR